MNEEYIRGVNSELIRTIKSLISKLDSTISLLEDIKSNTTPSES